MPDGIILAATIASSLICQPQTKNMCTVDGCSKSPLGVWSLVDQSSGTYARCDRNGCDTYPAKFTSSGEFLSVEVPGRAMLARIGPTNSFLEVVTLGLGAYITHGTCSPK